MLALILYSMQWLKVARLLPKFLATELMVQS